jgi:hypothetical protein
MTSEHSKATQIVKSDSVSLSLRSFSRLLARAIFPGHLQDLRPIKLSVSFNANDAR